MVEVASSVNGATKGIKPKVVQVDQHAPENMTSRPGASLVGIVVLARPGIKVGRRT